MKYLLNIKNVNKINLILFLIYAVPVLFTLINVSKEKERYYDKVVHVEVEKKSRDINTTILLTTGEEAKYNFDSDFFDQNSYLDLKKGDSVAIDFIKTKDVIGIKNSRNNNDLNFTYFVLYDYRWLSILIAATLLILNAFFYFDFLYLKKVYFGEQTDKSKIKYYIKKFNDWTKKYIVGFFIFIGLLIFSIIELSHNLKSNQYFLEEYYLYKYFFLLNIFLIPMPYIIINFFLLRKFRKNGIL